MPQQKQQEKGKNDEREEEEEEEEEDDGERVYSKIVRQSDGKKVTVQVKTKLKQVCMKKACALTLYHYLSLSLGREVVTL